MAVRIYTIFFALLLLTGCAGTGPSTAGTPNHNTAVSAPEGDLVVINEKVFIAQTNDIYINLPDYLGKTIQYQGIFKSSYWPEADTTYYYVIRYGPGCCGYDGEAGFEISWDGPLPAEDDWVEVVGVLNVYEENGMSFLRVDATSITVMQERGMEYVAQ